MSLKGMKKSQKKQEGKKGERCPETRQVLEKIGQWLFLFLIVGQNWLRVSAAAEGPQRRTEAVMRMQQEVQVKRMQMGGGDSTKVEAVTRGRQN